jgi:Zn-dependent M16 (insulinase) family peptidase
VKRFALFILLVAAYGNGASAQRNMNYGTLTEGQIIHGFRTSAVYSNDTDQPMGARFVHVKSGFTLDLLEIQSVPQAFVWVTTFPTSDMGEPHTQEHLLLGKGNKGRSVASHEPMSLAGSNAYTEQWRTCYHFYTSAGPDVFYDEFDRRMDALLHPDYTDEEVHREVRNFGVTDNPVDQKLTLDEKGTVYNEMVTSMDQPGRRLRTAVLSMIYGANHPLQFNSGGSPEALRRIQPSDIRKFHAGHYFLANMGAVISVPREMPLDNVLKQIDETLNRIEPRRPNLKPYSEKDLPAPRPAPAGQIQIVEYPNKNEQQPGTVWLAWPAQLDLDVKEQMLAELFLESFAGDATTNLYKRFIDSKTRDTDLGAQNVFASMQKDPGFSVIVGFGDVPVSKMNDKDLSEVRSKVIEEFSKVAALENGSPELKAFNDRVRSRVVETRRTLAKFVNSPPGFGFRNTYSDWIFQLTDLDKIGGFRRSVTMKSTLDAIDKLLAGNTNIWTRYIEKWKLAPSRQSRPPWIGAIKPAAGLAAQQQREREERVNAEVARLKSVFGVNDDQAALRRFRTDYDAATTVIDKASANVMPPKFIDNPPMTLDDQLDFKVSQVEGSVSMVASTFDTMTSATTGISLNLNGVPQDKLIYLAMLPSLLTRVGVIENGRPVSYPDMSERIRNEITSLAADYSTNSKTGRVELTVRGAGNNAEESRRSIEWMQLALFHPDWRPENLPRIRDLVDQVLNGLRRTPQTAEENWVNPVPIAYWRQDNPLFLATTSFMTQTHNVYRLRWMLKDASAEQRVSAAKALNEFAGLQGTRTELKAQLADVQNGSDKLLAEAAKDIDTTLADIPDSSLAIDWSRLCREMANDLSVGPEKTLSALDTVRTQIMNAGNARLFLISSSSTQQTLAPSIRNLVAGLDKSVPVKAKYESTKLVDARLRERDASAVRPIFVGLLNPNSQGGVFINSAPATAYEDTGRDKLLDYLSTNLYGGGGGHSIFMKTAAAGLAYSNGIGSSLSLGRLRYYAERTPELPQTMRFVIDQLKSAVVDPSLVEYAIAQAFTGTRSANSYESRGEIMAQNLADGLTPEVVSRFHKQILELRGAGDLAAELYRRKDAVSSMVLPGLGPKVSTVRDGIYFVIGPEKQFAAWEEYLKSVEGKDTIVFRLYPRDFWM